MKHEDFRQLVIDAGIVKPDYTKLSKLLNVSPQWARRMCTNHDCTHHEHIQKLEKIKQIARERKDEVQD